MPNLGHAGGWDEILLPVLLVLLVFYFGTRKKAELTAEEAVAPCEYCGRAPAGDEERCLECGFSRTR